MEGLYEFLVSLKGKDVSYSRIIRYKFGTGRKYFDFAIENGLLERVKNIDMNEECYRLTTKGEKLLISPNFNDALRSL